jgi:exodeoxyribonuclease-3
MVKIATWNVNSLRVRLPQVLDWVATQQPDMLALQETKMPDTDFPRTDLEAAGYQVAFAGQKTYNGVALLSRSPITEQVTDLPGLQNPQRRVLGVTTAGVRVLNLYVPNGQAVGSEKYDYKLNWLNALTDYLQAQLANYPKLVVLGDFNIAPEDRDVYDPKAWENKILCSEPERAALKRLLGLGLTDVFRVFPQPEDSFSWWDYRAAGFRRNHGLRIDLILASTKLTSLCTGCDIDKAPRRLPRPSDHTPVVAEFTANPCCVS